MFLTSVRSTVDKVISTFSHYRNEPPFSEWFDKEETIGARLKKFFENPEKFYSDTHKLRYRVKNHLAFDLGYDGGNLDEVVKRFQFVLISDYFDESLVLMKEQLCWSWHNLIYIKFKLSYLKEKLVFTPEQTEAILKWNSRDEELFQAFNQSFWKRAEDYSA